MWSDVERSSGYGQVTFHQRQNAVDVHARKFARGCCYVRIPAG